MKSDRLETVIRHKRTAMWGQANLARMDGDESAERAWRIAASMVDEALLEYHKDARAQEASVKARKKVKR